ncbi:MAG: phosphocholine cytidylyltransferase family protein [Candidatus Cloacimonetes bacterium]|nr:phosphocholine cytidylyltransferase family protein [Candidatus Cloacimonadota bacterium]
MQAIILAAGVGKRLQPLTNDIPKALIEVNGKSLLVNALDHLSGRDINEIVIVVGDKKEKIIDALGQSFKGMRITYVDNPIFDRTNNVYSLWLTREYISQDTILLECDLYYQRELIDTIMAGTAECNILASPYDKSTMSGTIIAPGYKGRAQAMIIKRDQKPELDYSCMMKTVNIYKFRKEFILNKFFPAIDLYVRTQGDQSYYELVLGSLIYFGNDDIRLIQVDSTRWCEIDDLDDLNRACNIAINHIRGTGSLDSESLSS